MFHKIELIIFLDFYDYEAHETHGTKVLIAVTIHSVNFGI